MGHASVKGSSALKKKRMHASPTRPHVSGKKHQALAAPQAPVDNTPKVLAPAQLIISPEQVWPLVTVPLITMPLVYHQPRAGHPPL